MKISFYLLTISSVLLLLSSCEEHKEKKHKKDKEDKEATSNETSTIKNTNTAINCDTSLWRYVYNPSRLQVIDYCKTVTGTIEESNADEDGVSTCF